MNQMITLREAVSPGDVAEFWNQLYAYFKRDMFPDPEDEDRVYFLGPEYRENMQKIHDRKRDRCYYLFFEEDDAAIGFALPVIYDADDGKCFLMEFCIYPEFRGKGAGRKCARLLLDWARENGASYAELNSGSDDRSRFWKTIGFRENGADEWGDPLMIRPPQVCLPIAVEVLSEPENWQLFKLENGFLKEIGEAPMEEEKQEMLSHAIREGKITFFVAKRGGRFVGMCSVAKCFSTFACEDIGVLDDFYIEPVFRGKGIARQLTKFAAQWCQENNLASLSVSCAPCDEGMYRALGFATRLGTTLAHIM